DADVAGIASAEIEAQVVADHPEEAFDHRLVEAILLLKLADIRIGKSLRGAVAKAADVEMAPPAIATVGGRLRVAGRLADIVVAAGDARGRSDRHSLCFRNRLFDRAAWCELDDHEVDHHDPEQGRNHEQQTSDDVGDHSGLNASRA